MEREEGIKKAYKGHKERGCLTSLRNSEETNKSDDLIADEGVRVPDLLWYKFTKSNIEKETTYTC